MNQVRSDNCSVTIGPHLYDAFVLAMPKILNVAGYRFRRVPCPDTREDCVCETIALCWAWYVQLVEKGRHPDTFITALASYGATAVHCGRRACGMERAKEVLSRRCQRRRGFQVSPLPDLRHAEHLAVEEALCDNTQTPVLDQVQFRIDFPAWRGRYPEQKQRLIDALMLGHRTKDLAVVFGISEGRISQIRKELNTDYAAFCEDGGE